MTNHPNRDKLSPLCKDWLAIIKRTTERHGRMPASAYMRHLPSDIRAVDRLINLGLVERVTPEGGGEISVRTVAQGESA